MCSVMDQRQTGLTIVYTDAIDRDFFFLLKDFHSVK